MVDFDRIAAWPPALRLLAACCRWPDGEGRRAAVSEAATGVEDWGAVRALAGAHRVEGLVAHALDAAAINLPQEMEQWRAAAAAEIRASALLQIRDTMRIAAEFERAGIAFRVLKGVPLAAAAYGAATLKHSWDVDVLVLPRQAVGAAERLAALGYASVKPPRALDGAEFERWSRVAKDAEFHGPGRVPLELHWRLLDLPWLLGELDAGSDSREVALLGRAAVPTFADHPNLAYLAVHGAAAGWSRLKWIADFSALLAIQPDEAAALAAARRFRTGFALDQAVLVRHLLFGTALPAGWRDSPRVRRLAECALTAIRLRSSERDIEQEPAALLAIRRSRRLLAPGVAYSTALWVRRLRGIEDRRLIPLPRGLRWAYWPLRPLSFAWRAVRKRLPSAAP